MKYQNKLDSHNTNKNPLDGLGMSPRPIRQHQRAIGDLFVHIRHHITNVAYEVLTEIELGGPNSKTPDVTVLRLSDDKPIMFIEVTNTKGLSIARKKVPPTLKRYKSVQEAFIYDYTKKRFYRVNRLGNIEEDESYSKVISYDLKKAFDEPIF
jgi:Uma2 family endonuclease